MGVASRALIRACVIMNGLRLENCQSKKMAAINNKTLAAIGNALFNDSSGESSHEERAIFGLEPKQELRIGVILSKSYATCIGHYQYSSL